MIAVNNVHAGVKARFDKIEVLPVNGMTIVFSIIYLIRCGRGRAATAADKSIDTGLSTPSKVGGQLTAATDFALVRGRVGRVLEMLIKIQSGRIGLSPVSGVLLGGQRAGVFLIPIVIFRAQGQLRYIVRMKHQLTATGFAFSVGSFSKAVAVQRAETGVITDIIDRCFDRAAGGALGSK